MATTSHDVFEVAQRISAQLKPLLADRDPELQGAVLADLLAVFIVGHHPALRDEVLKLHLDMLHQLIEVNEKIIFPDGLPDGWAEQ